MSVDELLEHIKLLDPAERAKVESYVAGLEAQRACRPPRKNYSGALADLGIDLELSDFKQMRRELNESFQRRLDRLEKLL